MQLPKRLSLQDFLQKSQICPILDVRSPAEYQHAHIPGAYNLPLFSDEERAIVGTTYKQVGKRDALLQGLDFVGGKLSHFVRKAEEIAPNREVCVHCWRGGMRSESMGILLASAGFQVYVLNEGYKGFRQQVLHFLEEENYSLHLIGGKTGSGKTEILHHLKALGEQVIDLEAIANHRGSAFGNVLLPPQPSSELFENQLFHQLSALDFSKRIWAESESRTIGHVFIPKGFWDRMQVATLFMVEMPIPIRVERLIKEYAEASPEELVFCLNKIAKKLGGLRHQQALTAFQAGELATATELLLEYYDKNYVHSVAQRQAIQTYIIEVNDNDTVAAAQQLVEIAIS